MNKKANRCIQWIIWHGTFAALIISGVVFGSPMAANVLKFLIWFTLIVTFITASKSDNNDKPFIPLQLTFFVDLAMASSLAAYGWFLYAGLLIAACLFALSRHVRKGEPKSDASTSE